MANECKFLD